jgi:hypothetical protein
MGVVMFAEGKNYPTLVVQNLEGEVEIGCGWCPLEEDEDE